MPSIENVVSQLASYTQGSSGAVVLAYLLSNDCLSVLQVLLELRLQYLSHLALCKRVHDIENNVTALLGNCRGMLSPGIGALPEVVSRSTVPRSS